MARSIGTGESWVERPLPPNKYREIVDPEFEIDWYCSQYGVSKPVIKQTYRRTREFCGKYNTRDETLSFSVPYRGVVLHELAHHICHKLGLNGRGSYHDHNFGRILQEMIDNEL